MNASGSTSPVATRGEEAVRAALIDAAAELLGEVGARSLSVREIARRAGVNHGQVHHYFGSKRALFEAAMRQLARAHFDHATALAGDEALPPPMSLLEDPGYWRALSRVVMDGDLELARIEIDEGISVPRRAMRTIQERLGYPDDDLDFKARVAALVALQLGLAAFEDFVLMITEVDPADRAAMRDALKRYLSTLTPEAVSWTSD